MKKASTKLFLCLLGAIILNSASATTFLDANSLPSISKKGSDGIKGKMFITAGGGLNLLGASLLVRYELSSLFYYDTSNFKLYTSTTAVGYKASPIFNVLFDYGVVDKLTVGAGLGFQTAAIEGWTHYNNVTGKYVSYTDNWTRINFGVRAMFSFLNKDKINLYTGMRLGYNMYMKKTTYGDPEYFDKLDVMPSPLSVQLLFGFRVFFTDNIGMTLEVGPAFGGPYYSSFGLTFKM